MKSTGAETKGEGEKGGGVNPDDSQRWVRIETGDRRALSLPEHQG